MSGVAVQACAYQYRARSCRQVSHLQCGLGKPYRREFAVHLQQSAWWKLSRIRIEELDVDSAIEQREWCSPNSRGVVGEVFEVRI
jgi:hypothetical protein